MASTPSASPTAGKALPPSAVFAGKDQHSKVVRVYENQRYYPVVGWSSKLLPTDRASWSDVDGSHALRKNDIGLPSHWGWVDDWKVEIKSSECDAEGWQYAMDFSRAYAKERSLLHNTVRRRCWIRSMAMDDVDAPAARRSISDKRDGPATPGEEKKVGTPSSSRDIPKEQIVELYEHQRYFPVVGWSTNLFPTDPEEWQDQYGNKATKESIQATMPAGWRWLNEWTRVGNARLTDDEGWSYAVDFGAADFHATKVTIDFVRKRKWIRTRTSVRSQFGVVYAENDLEKVDGYEQRIPSVLVELRAWLLTERGLEQEGIFRVSPDQGEAERARESLNDKNLQHSGDVHIASYLIKDWFGKLPHPLLADISTAPGDPLTQGGAGANEAGDVIKTIAEPYRSLLEWLLDLCVKTIEKTSVNRMTSENLAIVFAPNLARGGIELTRKAQKFIQMAIEYRKKTTTFGGLDARAYREKIAGGFRR